ncbi:MAG: hypothetical protein K2O44_00845 [Clostridia bacterium]|nr:hypothetical protein [Clostridia bacterium]
MSKGGSKLLTAIIAFLLGFLFAILVEVGAIFGVGWFVMNQDLDTVLGVVGIHNTDENGNKKYINTNPDDGGVRNLKELVSGLQGLVYENGEMVALGKSFDDFSQLIPATDMLLNMVYNTVDQFIELDKAEFESTPLSGLAQVLSSSIMGIRTAGLMEKLGVESVTGENASQLVKTLLMGAETEYATVYYGGAETLADEVEGEEGGEPAEPAEEPKTFKLPVMYDIFTYDEELDSYWREPSLNGISNYPSNLENNYDWLDLISEEQEDGEFVNKQYKLYYVPCRVTENGVEEAEYIKGEIEVTDGSGESAKVYKLQILEYGDDTDFIVVKRDDNGDFSIDYNAVYAALNANAEGASDRFTGYSYYEPYARCYYEIKTSSVTEKQEIRALCRKNYFRNNAGEMVQIDALTLSDIVDEEYAQDLTFGEVMDIKTTDNKLIKSLKDTPINKLDAKVKSLTVEELFDDKEIDGNSMLRQLRTTKITELATAMDELLIQMVYAEEVYKLPDGDKIMEVVEFDPANNYKYYTLEKYNDEGKDLFRFVPVNEGAANEGELTAADYDPKGKTVYYTYGADEGVEGADMKIVFNECFLFFEYDEADKKYVLCEVEVEDGATEIQKDDAKGKLDSTEFAGRGDKVYYSYGVPQSMWKLVLYKNKTEKGYTINNFDNMVNICANNVNDGTLFELKEAGIINANDSDLNKTFAGVTLGNMKLSELINAVISMAT